MAPEQLVKEFFSRLTEARVCMEQGLADGTAEIIKGVLGDIESEDFPDEAKEEIRSCAESLLNGTDTQSEKGTVSLDQFNAADPAQLYNYGLALIDGQFWEEAIQELRLAADLGFEPLKCRELCGDCALKLEKWQDAFRFYQSVYADENLGLEQKKSILAKIAKCSQEQKKEHAGFTASAKSGADPAATSQSQNPSVVSLDSCMADSAIGQTVTSWVDPTGNSLAGCIRSYKVTDLLHVGSSSLVVELRDQDSGRKFAGHALTGWLKDALPVEALAAWTKSQMLLGSRHLVRIFDLANFQNHFFVVREHLPLSLNDLLSQSSAMPVAVAVKIAYHLLEALGDLHLHMAANGEIRNIFHLDLRPSRILLEKDKPSLKIYNGGLWKVVEKVSPEIASLRELPLPHLSYRAPEQFRVYLARKRPPIFTDIYLFGTLFYEMLTGQPAFKGSSFEEYEIQHCEQYPNPPRVWRSEIPETLNELVMNCLACDPVRRFRSTTQISLALEKSFTTALGRSTDAAYRKYLAQLGLSVQTTGDGAAGA
jgi:serine/threonine protein kinase